MPRPRSFDTAAVTKAVTDVFWRKGYASTSMQDLVAATGVRAGSLHAAFGNKEDLFALAFDAYGRHFEACMDTGLSGTAAIAAYMQELLAAVIADRDHKGCLIVQAAAEADRHTGDIQAAVADRLDRMRQFFADRLAEANRADPDRANALFGAAVSILALGRTAIAPDVLTSIIEMALGQIGDNPKGEKKSLPAA